MREISQKLRRLLYVVPFVAQQPDGVSIDDLAEQVGVDRETIMRDLDLLTLVGPPQGDPGEYLLISVEEDRVYVDLAQKLTRPLRMTAAEGCSLLLGIRSLRNQEVVPYEEALISAESKLIKALGRDAEKASEMAERTVVAADQKALMKQVADLSQAATNRQSISINYVSASRATVGDRKLNPYGVVHHAGNWYLVAYCHNRTDLRTFRVDRILSLEVLDQTFEMPTDFSLDTYKREHLYVPTADSTAVQVRLNPRAAALVGSAWPAGELVRHSNGGADIIIDCEGFEWVTAWVLGFGKDAKIISPQSAIDVLTEKLQIMTVAAAS